MTLRRAWSLWLVGGIAATAFALLGPLDGLGRRGDLTAHVAQHLILGDVAAPLLLLGLPPFARSRLNYILNRSRPKVVAALLSPPGALIIWAVATTVWYLPSVHLAAAAAGPIHLLDHASFLVLGLLVWLAVFDVRPPRELRGSIARGGLPWWAQHSYAVGSRLLLIPSAVIVWFSPAMGPDRVDAASLLVGFEMFLFVFALVVTFAALAVHEGRRVGRTD